MKLNIPRNYVQVSAPGYEAIKVEFNVRESEFKPATATELHIYLFPVGYRTSTAPTDGSTSSILSNTTSTPANMIKHKNEEDNEIEPHPNEMASAVTSNSTNCNLVSPVGAFLLYLIVILLFSLAEI